MTENLYDRAPYPRHAYGFTHPGRMAAMVDRILKGAQPGDLPIEVVTQHKLSVNLALAREIGVTIPPEVLARADKVTQ